MAGEGGGGQSGEKARACLRIYRRMRASSCYSWLVRLVALAAAALLFATAARLRSSRASNQQAEEEQPRKSRSYHEDTHRADGHHGPNKRNSGAKQVHGTTSLSSGKSWDIGTSTTNQVQQKAVRHRLLKDDLTGHIRSNESGSATLGKTGLERSLLRVLSIVGSAENSR